MKVKVSFTVDIDPQAWEENYGVGPDRAAIREDVRTYVINGAVDQLRYVDVLAREV